MISAALAAVRALKQKELVKDKVVFAGQTFIQ
jgi:hypothetical protein